jgi:hypothetical protein
MSSAHADELILMAMPSFQRRISNVQGLIDKTLLFDIE